ncbi:hypothetical protein [Streptomyces physcomitrii]|uniref:Uncharacterized protein n=1 Tax=Streptomyces physcomitrii TaxID=2724184 RepID=A0ABX1H6C3_9ACTN|nr:hypothetical protein [Streptomyces physcomitrii]NKI42855.1 hypothetical protein [Streptomyces physcomitrii]
MSPQHTVITAADIERHWEAPCSRAVANGLDPRQIARDSLVICRHGGQPTIEYRAFVLDELDRNPPVPTPAGARAQYTDSRTRPVPSLGVPEIRSAT